jgi:hypothetical protein
VEARPEVSSIPNEQTLIQQHEVWFERAQEFQGRRTIRSDDDLVASLLRQHLTKPCGSGHVILDKQKLLSGGWFSGSPCHSHSTRKNVGCDAYQSEGLLLS